MYFAWIACGRHFGKSTDYQLLYVYCFFGGGMILECPLLLAMCVSGMHPYCSSETTTVTRPPVRRGWIPALSRKYETSNLAHSHVLCDLKAPIHPCLDIHAEIGCVLQTPYAVGPSHKHGWLSRRASCCLLLMLHLHALFLVECSSMPPPPPFRPAGFCIALTLHLLPVLFSYSVRRPSRRLGSRPSQVVQNRSTSRQVIINDHY